jgi:thioredoxin-like negative regulator of GroEL
MPAAGATELTKKTYGKFREGAKGGVYVVMHRMDGCVYCQMAKPAWDDAAKKAGPGACVAEMRYDPEWFPEEAADVRGFPTIRAYRDGRAINEYQGDRSSASILEFVKAVGVAKAAKSPKAASASAAKSATAKSASAKSASAAKPAKSAAKRKSA